jgi:hypothetical protein
MIALFSGSCCRYTYEIKDVNETPIFTLVGPILVCDGPLTCCCENKFQVNSGMKIHMFIFDFHS